MSDGGADELSITGDNAGQIIKADDDSSRQEVSTLEAVEKNGASPAGKIAEDGHSKKKRKPKKKAKKFPLLPSVLAAEAQLAWRLEQTTRLGRHAIAKEPIATGHLVLRERAVATVVRSQYAVATCHVCFRDLPTGESAVQVAKALLQQAPQYKRYCSLACAEADSHAALTAPVHGRLDGAAARVKVEPELLHLLLELDSRRSLSPPAVHVCADASGGWTLEASSPEHAEAESMHASSAGEPSGASKPGAQGASARADARQSSAAGPAAASGNDSTACSAENGWHGEQRDSQQSNGHGTSAYGASAEAARSFAGMAQKQQKAPEHAAGSEAGLPTVTCGLEDVSMLLAHGEKDRPEWRAVVSSAAKALQKAVRDTKTFEPGSTEELMELAAIINANAHGSGAANSSNTDRGLGLYPALSMLNHSCRPNCAFVGNGPCMEVRAVRDIKAGEQLTVSYTNITEPRKIRAAELRATKHFVCACERCTEPLATSIDASLEAVRCREGKCEGYLLEQRPDNLTDGEAWTCTACSRSIPSLPPPGSDMDPAKYPGAVTEQFKLTWNQCITLQQTKGHVAAKPAFERLLGQARAQLHPMHVAAIDCLMPLVNCSRAVGDPPQAIKHLQQLLSALEAVYGCHTVEIGNLYGLLGRLYVDRASSLSGAFQARYKKQAKEAFNNALAAYKTCLGESQEQCKELQGRIGSLR